MKDTNQLITARLKNGTRRNIYKRHGAYGIKLICAVYGYTQDRTLCIGRIKDIGMLFHSPNFTKAQTLKLIEQSGLFVVDHEKGIFYSPKVRKDKNLSVKPTAREIYIAINKENEFSNIQVIKK